MIPDFEISKCPEHEVKSKIGTIFVNEKIFEEYSVKIHEIDPYFHEHYKKKYKLMKMEVNTYYLELIFILLNILQQQKLMKKVILIEILCLKKREEALEKTLNCKFIRINTSRGNYDVDYEASRMQVFISQFKETK